MPAAQIIAIVFALVILAMLVVIYRLPTKTDRSWTPNEKSTLVVSVASLFVAAATLIFSVLSNDTREAVGHLADLAREAQHQTSALNNQVTVVSDELAEQKLQTGFLSAQAKAAGNEARASQASVGVSQGLLAAAKLSEKRSVAEIKYQMRLQAMQTFRQGDAAFDTVLLQIRDRLAHDIEEPRDVANLTPNDLEEIREATDPIISASRLYQAAIDATIPAWPADLRQIIVKARNEGMAVAQCYAMGSMKAITPQEFALVRMRLNANCRDLGTKYHEFRRLSEAAIVEMQNEVFNDASEMGTRPNFPTPDSVRPSH